MILSAGRTAAADGVGTVVRDQSNQFGGKDGKNTPLYPSLCKRNEKVITKFYLVAGSTTD